jgi:hypothetical protein
MPFARKKTIAIRLAAPFHLIWPNPLVNEMGSTAVTN